MKNHLRELLKSPPKRNANKPDGDAGLGQQQQPVVVNNKGGHVPPRQTAAAAAAGGGDVEVENLSGIIKLLNGGKERYAVLLHNVLTPEECQQLIQRSEETGFEPALLNIGGGRQVVAQETRNNDRCIIDDPEIAEAMLYQRVLAKLQQAHDDGDDDDDPRSSLLKSLVNRKLHGIQHHAVGCNERLRVLRYDPGTFFAPHFDGYYMRRGEAGWSRRGEVSMITVQLYLNEGFQGGATRFIKHEDHSVGFDVVPRTGSVLLFQHDILHEGSLLIKGRKYAKRTDLMYTTEGPGHEYSKGLCRDDDGTVQQPLS